MNGLWALVPLVLYIVLCFCPFGQIFAVIAGIIVAAVMGGHGLMDVAAGIRAGMGSFLGYIGLIILLGGGLGMVLKRTGVVDCLVAWITGKMKVDSQRKAFLLVMICSVLIVSVLGTMAGGNAILAPVLIPIAASVGVVPNAMAVLLHGAGATGLFLGPFTPPVVALMEFTGVSYPQYLLNAGIPISLIMWIVTFFWAGRVQKKYAGVTCYAEQAEEAALDLANYRPDGRTKLATATFFVVLIGLVVWGISIGGGSTFVLGLMLVTAALTGLAGRLKVKEIIDAVCDGARPLVWLFFFFVLLDPFINFISDAGAFQALAGVLAPYVEKSGHVAFVAFTTLVGIFGVPGAAVAQAEVLNKMFLELAQAQGIPMVLWAAVLLVGSQMTSFAMPEGDMQGQMGLARSDDLKSVLCNGWLICLFTTLYVVVRAFFI